MSTDPTPIPLIDVAAQYSRLRTRIDARVRKVLAEGRYVLGPEVTELETALAERAGVPHTICVANGTDALKIALLAWGIGPGDAVFVPAFTFVATAEIVADVGATPVFVDIDRDTFCLCPAHLAEQIDRVTRSGRLRPRGIIPVDLFGQPADYDRIAGLAETHGLFLLADAAQSLGGRLHGRPVGALAPVTATSFYPSKPLACYGDGGCIFTDDPGLAATMRTIARHGFGRDGHLATHVGLNSRLDTLQAGVLLAKLEVFEDEIASRARIATQYADRLPSGIEVPRLGPGRESAWAVYGILTEDRDALRSALTKAGIATAIYYTAPLHLHPAYDAWGDGPGSLPVSENVSDRILALPMHPYLDESTLERICGVVTKALG